MPTAPKEGFCNKSNIINSNVNANVESSGDKSAHRVIHSPTTNRTVSEALSHSYRVGLSGGSATLLSVATMMWLHTIVTYQQRHGTSFSSTAQHLWSAGGPRRFYRGLLPSLAVAPICRFGDTLCNELAVTLLQSDPNARASGDWGVEGGGGMGVRGGRGLPVWVTTFVGSLGAAVFHAAVVPLDTYKTVMQVEGHNGLQVMKGRIARRGPLAAYDGALAFAGGSLMGHYPWYLTYNLLERHLPQPKGDDTKGRIRRSALIGTVSSIVSAATSNSLRVIKVYRQSHRNDRISYAQSIANIVKKDGGGVRGVMGVFGRGLAGRAAASGIQGLVFNVIWREITHWSEERAEKKGRC